MASRDDDDLLGAYIQRLHELEHDDTPALDAAGLADVARQMGVDDEVLQKADAKAADALLRGKGLLAARRYGEAIDNLTLAVDLRPYDIEPVREMGRALLMRGKATGVKADKTLARSYLDRALELAPNDEATRHLLDDLDGRVMSPAVPPDSAPKVTTAAIPKANRIVLMVSGALLALGIAFGVGLSQHKADSHKEVTTAPVTAPTKPAKPHVIPQRKPLRKRVVPRYVRSSDKEVPVELIADSRLRGMKLANVRSTFTSGRSNWYRGAFELAWHGDKEIARLELQAEGLDEAGKRVAVKTLHAVRRYAEAARPGDRLPQSMLFRAARPVAKIVIKPLVVFTQPAAKKYPEGAKVSLVWEIDKPAGIDLAANLRSETLRRHGTAKSFHKASVMVRNTGERAVSHLKVQYRYTDSSGQVLDAVDRYVVMSTAPTLMPGSARSTLVVRILPRKPHAWTMHVIEVR